jgi:hypothetical protein
LGRRDGVEGGRGGGGREKEGEARREYELDRSKVISPMRSLVSPSTNPNTNPLQPTSHVSTAAEKKKKTPPKGQMPPAENKQKTSLKDAYFKKLNEAITRHHCKGSMLIVAINDSDDDDVDDEKELSAAELSKLRYILINDSRDKALTKAHKFASCNQDQEGFAMFNTHEGNLICHKIPGEIKKALKKTYSTPERFDHLFALTHGLKTYDFWIRDNECWEPGQELEKAMKALAKAWRDMLKSKDEELGIDADYTRPGIEALLTQLQEEFEDCESAAAFKFNWRA